MTLNVLTGSRCSKVFKVGDQVKNGKSFNDQKHALCTIKRSLRKEKVVNM